MFVSSLLYQRSTGHASVLGNFQGDARDSNPGECVQLALLSRRKARNTVRHPWLFVASFAATLATALLMGAVYARMGRMTPGIQDRFASFFFTILYLSLSSLSSLPIWQEERALCARERAAGVYGSAAYVATTVTFDLLTLRILPPLFLATVGYSMMGLRGGLVHRLRYWAAITLCNVAAASASMAIGAAASSTSVANTVASLAVLVNLLFGGFLLSLHKLPRAVATLSRLSYARYAYEILVANEFAGAGTFMLTPFSPPGTKPESLPHKDVSGSEVLRIFFFDAGRVEWDLLGLLALAALYIALTAALLHFRR
jgi:ABC-2 type transporter